jgi:hypothetical protein
MNEIDVIEFKRAFEERYKRAKSIKKIKNKNKMKRIFRIKQ